MRTKLYVYIHMHTYVFFFFKIPHNFNRKIEKVRRTIASNDRSNNVNTVRGAFARGNICLSAMHKQSSATYLGTTVTEFKSRCSRGSMCYVGGRAERTSRVAAQLSALGRSPQYHDKCFAPLPSAPAPLFSCLEIVSPTSIYCALDYSRDG